MATIMVQTILDPCAGVSSQISTTFTVFVSECDKYLNVAIA